MVIQDIQTFYFRSCYIYKILRNLKLLVLKTIIYSYLARAVVNFIFFYDGFSAHRADVILLDPYVQTFQVENVISITIQFCDFLAVPYFELLQANDAGLNQFVTAVFTWIENTSSLFKEFFDVWQPTASLAHDST